MHRSNFSQGRRTVRPLACCIALVPLFLLGCAGEAGPELHPVEGTVTFDGEPIEDGRITFRKVEGDRRAYSGQINNGQYKLESEAGEMTVEITASRIIPGKFDTSNPDDEPQPVGEMYIPAEFNSETTLKATVAPSGENKIPFALTGDGSASAPAGGDADAPTEE